MPNQETQYGPAPAAFEILDLGYDEESYFPGCGLYGTKFTDLAIGHGDTTTEALDDALEQLACQGWDTTTIAQSEDYTNLASLEGNVRGDVGCACDECDPEDCEGCAVCAGTYHRYVAIRVR